MRRAPALLLVAGLSGCAGSQASPGQMVSPTYDFTAVKSVYVHTPEVRLRSGGGGDTRALEIAVADALREHLRQAFGWVSAQSVDAAQLAARFELTDWESNGDGTRVGGHIILETPVEEQQVFSASAVYPSRFGIGAPGTPLENLRNLFETLLRPLREHQKEK